MTLDKRLSTNWTQNLQRDKKAKEDFESVLRNSTQLLTRLREIIEAEELSIYREEGSEEDYSDGWQFLQAHRNGKKEALRFIKKLTDHISD